MSDRGFMFRRDQRLEPAQAARSAGPRANATHLLESASAIKSTITTTAHDEHA